ncbi:MAG: polyprenyl diphosphate synthase [Bacilli bacterium]|nr:polyprenyl diphosphate synthase [Bacilli bacterium]
MKKSAFKLSKPLKHIAFIMDGNGRWAKAHHKPRTYGHRVAISQLMDLMEECSRLGIKGASLFAFSTENWKRPKTEVRLLFKYLEQFLKRELPRLMKDKMKLYISGDYHRLPSSTVAAIDKAVKATSANQGMKLNICLNYGGEDDIVHAVNTIIKQKIKQIDSKTFAKYLYAHELGPIDLLIRTSGECRISNFMLYQLAYSELIFDPTPFPDFHIENLHQCLVEYSSRERRYGGLKHA